MKYSITLCTIMYFFTANMVAAPQACSLCIEPIWQQLDDSRTHFNDKWVLIGSITFAKKCIESVSLSKIHLRWHGASLDTLVASLYLKDNNEEQFKPIEDNFVCDARWNKAKQKLVFNFSKPFKLGLETTFYVVLTYPDQEEELLRNGSFSLEMRCLPQQLQHAQGAQLLSLAPHHAISSVVIK